MPLSEGCTDTFTNYTSEYIDISRSVKYTIPTAVSGQVPLHLVFVCVTPVVTYVYCIQHGTINTIWP